MTGSITPARVRIWNPQNVSRLDTTTSAVTEGPGRYEYCHENVRPNEGSTSMAILDETHPPNTTLPFQVVPPSRSVSARVCVNAVSVPPAYNGASGCALAGAGHAMKASTTAAQHRMGIIQLPAPQSKAPIEICETSSSSDCTLGQSASGLRFASSSSTPRRPARRAPTTST